MSGVNQVILLGRLGRDPECKALSSGDQVANFSIATSKSWKDASGTKQERTEWHNIVAFKKLAEIAGKYLTKGRQVYVSGELQTRSWEDKDGQKKYKTEIVAHRIEFIGDKPAAASQDSNTDAGGFGPPVDDLSQIPF